MAKEAIELYIESLKEHGAAQPADFGEIKLAEASINEEAQRK